MTDERWGYLMATGAMLSREEYEQGWHYCNSEWDGLLIGPGMDELKDCTCVHVSFDQATRASEDEEP